MGGSQWEPMVGSRGSAHKKNYSKEMTKKNLPRSLFALNLSYITSLIFLVPSSSKHVFASIFLDRCCTFSYTNLFVYLVASAHPPSPSHYMHIELRQVSFLFVICCQFNLIQFNVSINYYILLASKLGKLVPWKSKLGEL